MQLLKSLFGEKKSNKKFEEIETKYSSQQFWPVLL